MLPNADGLPPPEITGADKTKPNTNAKTNLPGPVSAQSYPPNLYPLLNERYPVISQINLNVSERLNQTDES